MTKPSTESANPMPLRFSEPDYYELLLRQLEALHLHPFDVHASVTSEGDSRTVTVRYGDDPVSKSRTLISEAGNGPDGEWAAFFRECAEDCKKTLIADYYKLMKS